MALTPPPAAPQRGDRATFAQRVDAFITWLISFVTEFNAAIAALNAWLAGGVYSIPYTYNWKALVGTPGGGVLSHNDPFYLLNATDYLYLDLNSAAARSVAALINEMDDSTSAIRGKIRLEKVGDPNKWALFDVIGPSVHSANHSAIRVAWTAASASPNPFTQGEQLILFFQRTGDKGDAGIASCLKVSDRKSAAEGGAASVGWNTRTLNTVDTNTITGASLASNTVTLPAGTFDVFGRAPATQNIHKAALYNVTDTVYALIGSNAQSSSSGASTDSIVVGRITITSPKTFQLRHYVNSTSGSGTHFGFTSGSGQIDVYSELQFLKVA